MEAIENPRLQRMKEQMSPYVFKTIWCKGKEHLIPDALSRAPVSDLTPEDHEFDTISVHQIQAAVMAKVAAIAGDDTPPNLVGPVLDELRQIGKSDPACQALLVRHHKRPNQPAPRLPRVSICNTQPTTGTYDA